MEKWTGTKLSPTRNAALTCLNDPQCIQQAQRIAALEAVVADLREQLAAAERSARNSGNSSMPPSSDDLPGKKPPRKQRRAAERAEKKKRGKQPVSPQSSMTW